MKHNKKEGDQSRTIAHKKAMLEALRASLGVVTPALEKAGVGRKTYYQWLQDDPEFKAETMDFEEVALDYSESRLHKLIREENPTAIIFHLKTKGKKRGYIERQEVEAMGGEMKIVFENVSKKYEPKD